MTTLMIVAAVVLASLVVHIGLFLWIRARIRGAHPTEAKSTVEAIKGKDLTDQQ